MLDAAFNAKLGDFGLARLVDHGRGAHTTELAGTMGYMDPDCMITGRFSTESDMYSFGVVLLEVACGRRPVVAVPQESAVVHLARRVLEMHGRGEVLDAADRRLGGDFDAHQMERVLLVGLWCTQQDRSLRPSIWQAIRALRFEASLPTITKRGDMTPGIHKTRHGSMANLKTNSVGGDSASLDIFESRYTSVADDLGLSPIRSRRARHWSTCTVRYCIIPNRILFL